MSHSLTILLVPICLHLSSGNLWGWLFEKSRCSVQGTSVFFQCPLWKIIRMYCPMLPFKSQSSLAQHSGGSGSLTMKISWICTQIPADLLFPYLYQEDYKVLVFIETARNAFHKQRDRWEEIQALELWWVLELECQSQGPQWRDCTLRPCTTGLHQRFYLWAAPNFSIHAPFIPRT